MEGDITSGNGESSPGPRGPTAIKGVCAGGSPFRVPRVIDGEEKVFRVPRMTP